MAGVAEWGWPVGLKLGWAASGTRSHWIIFSVACMIYSGALLLNAQASVPTGVILVGISGLKLVS